MKFRLVSSVTMNSRKNHVAMSSITIAAGHGDDAKGRPRTTALIRIYHVINGHEKCDRVPRRDDRTVCSDTKHRNIPVLLHGRNGYKDSTRSVDARTALARTHIFVASQQDT